MAKRSFSTASSSFTPQADGASISGNCMCIQAASSANMVNVLEISVSGQAGASTIANGLFARNSQAGASITTPLVSPFADGPLYNQSTAATAGIYTAAGTVPQRSASVTASRLNLSLNAFGGIYRWVAAPGEEWSIYGVAAGADSGFSLTTAGTGATATLGVHIIYEPL